VSKRLSLHINTYEYAVQTAMHGKEFEKKPGTAFSHELLNILVESGDPM